MGSSKVFDCMSNFLLNIKLLKAFIRLKISVEACANCFEYFGALKFSLVDLSINCKCWVQWDSIYFSKKFIAIKQVIVSMIIWDHFKWLVHTHLNFCRFTAHIFNLFKSTLNYLVARNWRISFEKLPSFLQEAIFSYVEHVIKPTKQVCILILSNFMKTATIQIFGN